MKVSTKKKAVETLRYLEEIGALMWDINEIADDKVKGLIEKMHSYYTTCAENLKEMCNE